MSDQIDEASEMEQATLSAQLEARRKLVEAQRIAIEKAGGVSFTHCINCGDEITSKELKGKSRFCSVECSQDYEKRYKTLGKQNAHIGQYIN